MTDAIVTGAAGFIGSHLTEQLLAQGNRVLGIDCFDSYYGRPAKSENLASARENPRFRLLARDVRSVRLERYLGPDTRVFHIAAQPGVRGSWGQKFARYVENNVQATQAVLESVSRGPKGARVIYASSSSVYGDQPEGPMSEEALPNPISPYGVTKLAAEHLTRVYARAHGLSVVSLRFFNVYGPRQRPDMAFRRFFRAVGHGEAIEVYGTGRQSRDFTYVSDTVDGLLRASETRSSHNLFNLGAGAPARLDETIREIGRITGRRVRIRRLPPLAGDARATWADTRRAREELGFRPRVRLREGLRLQWEWQVARGECPPNG